MGASRLIARGDLLATLDRAVASKVTIISAPAGSGKTSLLSVWASRPDRAHHIAFVPVRRDEQDAQLFWLALLNAVRHPPGTTSQMDPPTATPGSNVRLLADRVRSELGDVSGRVTVVIDDLHELNSPEALAHLTHLLTNLPLNAHAVLATRRDLRLGLHQLRLAGELTEIRAADLRFTERETLELLDASGIALSEAGAALLHQRTEGWAAGLRLAAISLAGHPDPERFVAEFSGSDRTVAEYLIAEMLERQPDDVQDLLLRTSLLDRINGELADLLTGRSGSERLLLELEDANAFVVSLDPERTWFRYHHLFGDLLRLELRRTKPDEQAALHRVAADWLAKRGHPVEAVRQAQSAEDWKMAAQLLSDHWLDLYLGGRVATLAELLGRFPRRVVAASPELTTVQVAGDLVRGSVEDAGRHLARASGALAAVPADRRGRVQVMLAVLRLFLARRLVDFPVVAEEAERLLALMESTDAAQLGLGEDLRAAALISLGIAEMWALQFKDGERHLEQGMALARRIGRPYLELTGLAHGAHAMLLFRPDAAHAEWSGQAIELAERHGWGEEPLAGMAYAQVGFVLLYQGRLDEAEPWLERAERTLRTEVEPAAGMSLRHARALLEVARGRPQEALAASGGAEKLAATLADPHTFVTWMRSRMLQTLVRLGQAARAEQVLAELGEDERATAEMRTAEAALRLAVDDPQAAVVALAPMLDGSIRRVRPMRMVTALLLEAQARDALSDQATAGRVLEKALDITESNGILLPFLLDPSPALLERHRRYGTAHPALISQILDLLPTSARPAPRPAGRAGWARSRGLSEQLTDSETRVLRYLPTHLTVHEIATELFLSVNTVSTHKRHLFAKLGVHSRHEAVDRARALGLLVPAARKATA